MPLRGSAIMQGARSDFLNDVLRRDVFKANNRRAGAPRVSQKDIEKLADATRVWLKAQAEDLLALIEGKTRAKNKSAFTREYVLSSINRYYRSAAEQGAEALKKAVAEHKYPDWADMDAAISSMAQNAFTAVKAEIGEGVSEEWIKGFLERYSTDMGLRLARANMNELTRVVSAAEVGEAFNALCEKLGSWYSKGDSGRAELMAKNEAALCVNEAKTAAYRHAGYTSKWVTGAKCCEACQRLNGQMIMTLKLPLHTGCSCYVTVGDKVKPEWLTKEFDPGTIESTEEVRE